MIVTTCFLVLGCAATAREEPKPITLSCTWKVGARFEIGLTKTRERWDGAELTQKSVNVTPIEAEVLEKRDDGYRLRWTLGRSAIVVGETSAMSDRMAALNEGLQIEFETDALGSFQALAAPEKIEAEMALRIGALGGELPKQGMNPEEIASFTRILGQSYKGEAYRALLSKEPQLYYMPSGSTLVVGQKRAWESSVPNPLGGAPLPANAYLELRAVRPEKSEAVVEWRQTIDPAKAGPILESSLRAAAKRSGKPLPEDAPLNLGAIEDAATYVYDLKTGWPRSVEWTHSSTMAGVRSIESARFDVTPKPAK